MGLAAEEASNGKSVGATIGILGIGIRRIGEQVVHTISIVVRRRPPVTVVALIASLAVTEVPGQRRRECSLKSGIVTILIIEGLEFAIWSAGR